MKLIKEIWGNLPFQVRVVMLALVVGLVFLAVILARIDSCRTRRDEQRIEQTKDAIRTSEVEANVLANKQAEVETNANNANSDLNRVLGTDSGNRNADFGTVKRRWCDDHPGDSKCR